LDWINSKDSLLRWADKEKALDFISTQWPNYIAGGNKAQSNSGTNINKHLESAILKGI